MVENDRSTSKGSVIYPEDKIWSSFLCILVSVSRRPYESTVACSSLTSFVSQFNIFLGAFDCFFFIFFHEVTLLNYLKTNRAEILQKIHLSSYLGKKGS